MPKKSQKRKFEELARAAKCDEDENAFDEKLKRIATAKPGDKGGKAPDKKSED